MDRGTLLEIINWGGNPPFFNYILDIIKQLLYNYYINSIKEINMSEIKQTQDRLEKIVAAKFRHPEIADLDDLINVLQEIDEFNDRYLDDVPNTFGEVGDHLNPPIDYDDLVSDLPSFGVEPNVRSINADTQDIWSHDNERLLVSNWLGERWRLADRKEWEGLDDQ